MSSSLSFLQFFFDCRFLTKCSILASLNIFSNELDFLCAKVFPLLFFSKECNEFGILETIKSLMIFWPSSEKYPLKRLNQACNFEQFTIIFLKQLRYELLIIRDTNCIFIKSRISVRREVVYDVLAMKIITHCFLLLT